MCSGDDGCIVLGMSTQHYIHPSALDAETRRENRAALQDRIASAMERAGGISAKRDAPVARRMAERIRKEA